MRQGENLRWAKRAVVAAARATRFVQAGLQAELDARTKADRTPVTVADLAAQAVVGHLLQGDFVGEEDAELLRSDAELRARALEAARQGCPDLDEARLIAGLERGRATPPTDGRAFWTLDPVDGTKGFLRGAHYCISLALVEGGVSKVGALGCPRLGAEPSVLDDRGALLWAEAGGGAFGSALDDEQPAAPLRSRPFDRGRPLVVAESAEASHTDHDLTPRVIGSAGLQLAPPLRIDSQVKYGVVARGDADLFIRKPKDGYREKIWDHAGGALVAKESGCTVSDFDGRPLRFDDGELLAPHRGILVSSSPELHQALLAQISP